MDLTVRRPFPAISPEVRTGLRFLGGLPGFLRRPIDPTEAQAVLRHRLATREADFLALIRVAVFPRPESPYRRLLELAGCTYGDLEALVRHEGLEGALTALYRAGVYVSLEEFRGRHPLVRGGVTVDGAPAGWANPLAALHLPAETGGRTGAPLPVHIDLAFLRDLAVDFLVAFHARGGRAWTYAYWNVPGGAAMSEILAASRAGLRVARWFSQVDPAAPGLHARYRWSARVMRVGSLLAGRPLPLPQHVPLDDPEPVLRWIDDVRRAGAVPHLKTFGSTATHLCRVALETGRDLAGLKLSVSGEPVTAARLEVMRRAGAEVVPRAGSRECGLIGAGCLRPGTADDLHVHEDLHAVVQPGRAAPLAPDTLLFSSLRPTAPLVLLNVSLGDEAVLGPRTCGCPLEALGLTTHIHDLRNSVRLTVGGIKLFEADVARVLDTILPARFGGGPTDYQLCQEDGSDPPRLHLLVHPRLGPVDSAAVGAAFLAAVGAEGGAERVASLAWDAARVLRVERRAPVAVGGKIPQVRRSSAESSERWAAG
ncbi:MAG TPA: hypothetical protein VIE44_06310 [Methylomirabilota bacterium]